MNTIKKYRREIFISIATGILVLYLKPLLDSFGSVLISTCILVSVTFSNYYYTSVALNDSNAFIDLTYLLLIELSLLIIFYGIVNSINPKKAVEELIQKTLKKNSELKVQILQPELKVEKSREERLKELEAIDKEIKQADKDMKSIMRTLYILWFFLGIFLFTSYAFTKTVSSENVVFRNDIFKIAPFTNDIEIKEIQAQWTSMKNKRDYENVTKIVSEIKKNNKIE